MARISRFISHCELPNVKEEATKIVCRKRYYWHLLNEIFLGFLRFTNNVYTTNGLGVQYFNPNNRRKIPI